MVGFARAGSLLFWKTTTDTPTPGPAQPLAPILMTGALLAMMALLTVFSAPVLHFLTNTATQLHTPAAYIAAVLGGGQ